MFRLRNISLLAGLGLGLFAVAQQATQTPPTQTPAAQPGRGQRPPAPTRDPNTPGYVSAKDLPDGENAPANADGNFILGPTHPAAPEMTVKEGVPQGTVYDFTIESKVSDAPARSPRLTWIVAWK